MPISGLLSALSGVIGSPTQAAPRRIERIERLDRGDRSDRLTHVDRLNDQLTTSTGSTTDSRLD
jgi:hypothetical protein